MEPAQISRHQLFVCCTPYHVLMSHLVVEHLGLCGRPAHSRPVLVLTMGLREATVAPVTVNRWWSSRIEAPVWRSGYGLYGSKSRIDAWLARQPALNREAPTDIYVGNDLQWQHQLIVSAFAKSRVFLFEDGMGSYVPENRTHRPFNVLARRVVYKSLWGARYRNVRGVGRYPADGYYCLRDDGFPGRTGAAAGRLTVLPTADSAYLSGLHQKLPPPPKDGTLQDLFMTQPFQEQGQLTARADRRLHERIGEQLRHLDCLWIKAHPMEDAECHAGRIAALQAGHGGPLEIRHIDLDGPVELLFFGKPRFSQIVGITSTALISARSSCPQSTVISAARLMPPADLRRSRHAISVMERAGIEFF